MSLFWRHRFQRVETESGWTLSFADLMSLLMAVFVMIAAMGDWKSSEGFAKVSEAMRSAFGTSMFARSPAVDKKPPTPQSLVQRLASVGFGVPTGVQLSDDSGSDLPACEMIALADRMVLRVGLDACFDGEGAVLTPGSRRLMERLGEYLREGAPAVTVRCPLLPIALGSELPWRDRWDQAYERARSVTQALVQMGISPQRLEVSAGGVPDELARSIGTADGTSAVGAADRPAMEIVVMFAGQRRTATSRPGESR